MTSTNNCSICDSKLEEENGDTFGYFGILPVGFCVWCMSSVTDMVFQMNDLNNKETLLQRIEDLEE